MSERRRRLLAWPAVGENPYQWVLYGELRRRGWEIAEFSRLRLVRLSADVVHIHWPDLVLVERRSGLRLLKAAVVVVLLWLARVRRRGVVWTVHNPALRLEQSTRWGPRYLRLVARACSGLIFLSRSHLGAYGGVAARKPVVVIPQPSYRGVYGEPRQREEARRRLGLEPIEPVVGFFGQVRPYKNLELLAAAFRSLSRPGSRLLVAGRFEPVCRDLAGALAREPRAVVLDRHVPNEEVPWLLAAMDLVVLPYTELGNSAVALLALSYERPVLAPAAAKSILELRDAVGPAWVRLYEGPLEAGALAAALDAEPPTEEPDLSTFEPRRIGELTHRFLAEMADRHRAP